LAASNIPSYNNNSDNDNDDHHDYEYDNYTQYNEGSICLMKATLHSLSFTSYYDDENDDDNHNDD
jgi:hypothetical protein